MLRMIYVLVSGTNSLVHVHLVFNGGTLLYFVNYSVFGSLSEDSARWDLAPWNTLSSKPTDHLQYAVMMCSHTC